ncbi:MAG: GNAT family N-acetyltransferase [Acidimicrobiales bacterium]
MPNEYSHHLGDEGVEKAFRITNLNQSAQSPNTVAFRYASLDDVEAVAAYHHRCWVGAFSAIVPVGLVDSLEVDHERWRSWFADESDYTTVVATMGGEAVGHCTVIGNELMHLFIDPSHWGKGLGKSLLTVGERILRQAGNREIVLRTIVGNDPAIAMYTANGWAVTDETIDDDVNGFVYTEHVLTKDLESAQYVEANRTHWDDEASDWVERGRRSWARQSHWGEMMVPEVEVGALDDVAGCDVVELGCGTGYVSAWCLRAGAKSVVGLDNSSAQLRSALVLQGEFDLSFPLIWGDAELTPFADDSFDFAVSEYGAAIWCDPHKWIPEAARILRPEGRLVFLGQSLLLSLCMSDFEGDPTTPTMRRPQRDMHRFEYPDVDSIEFHLSHGEMIGVLRSAGFEVLDLIELYASDGGPDRYSFYDAAWARQWPAEELWVARLAPG